MKLKSDAHPPYKYAWKLKDECSYKWLAERLEEGYLLHSASGDSHQSCLRCGCFDTPRSSLRPGGGAFTRERLQRVN